MVIDDSETVRIKITQIIKDKGHEVIEAENGQIALDIITKTLDIDFCICDINMPEMDGLTLVEEVRRRDWDKKNLVFVMCTTETSAGHKMKAKELGVRGWLHKPFKNAQIEQLLEFMAKESNS
tara:strand:+ start:4489 stop:4857 length:369 start_codon:yes stop_codon:yes gene_type:complete